MVAGIVGCGQGKFSITFADPAPVWWNAVPLFARLDNYYGNLEVNRLEVPTGVKSKDAVVAGNAEVGTAAVNAFTVSNAEQIQKLRVLASVTQTSSVIGIVSRKNRPIDLTKDRFGFVANTIAQFYLVAYLRKLGKTGAYKDLSKVFTSPVNVVTAFNKKDIDVAIAWEPFLSQLIDSAGGLSAVDVIRDETLYQQQIFLMANSQSLNLNKDAVSRFLAAMKSACEYISSNRTVAAERMENYFKFSPGFLTHSLAWQHTQFEFQTDASVMRQALQKDFQLIQDGGIAVKVSQEQLDTMVSPL